MGRNVTLLTLYNIFRSMIFFIPVVVPYYKHQIGLSYAEFLWGEAIFAASMIIFEVPSGYLSDVWQRRRVLILSALSMAIGFVILMLSRDFFTMAVSQVIMGLAVSLMSGTDTALLYDSLLSVNRQKEYKKLEGRRQGFGLYGVAFSGIAGGFLYAVHVQLPNVAGIVCALLAALCAYLMVEPPRYREQAQTNPFKDVVLSVRYAVKGHPEIGFILLFTAILFSGTKIMMWSQQPYFMEMQIDEMWFGVLFGVGFFVGGLSSQLAHVLERYCNHTQVMMLGLLAVLLSALVAMQTLSWWGVVALMIGGTTIYGLVNPHVLEAINARVSSARRATILSTGAFGRSLFFIPVSSVVGYFNERDGIETALGSLFVWFAFAGLMLVGWAILRKHNQARQNKI